MPSAGAVTRSDVVTETRAEGGGGGVCVNGCTAHVVKMFAAYKQKLLPLPPRGATR